MTATSLRHELDGPDADVVHVVIPWGCHTPRVKFLTDEPRVLTQLLQSRRGAQGGLGSLTVAWAEGDVAVRVDLTDRGTEEFPPAAPGEPPVAPAAAAATPATSRPVVARRRRKTSITANLSRDVATEIDRLIERALEANPDGFDLDLLRAGKHTLERALERVRTTS